MSYIQIASCASRLEAETFGHILKEKHIPYIVKSEDVGIGGGAGGSFGATLWVPQDCVERARRVLPCIFPDDDSGDALFPEPSKV